MKNVYYCEFRLCGNFACHYVIASCKLDAVHLLTLHYMTLSPYLKITDVNVRSMDFISSETIDKLNNQLYGND